MHNTTKGSYANLLYHLIQEHDYVIAPLSSSLAGGIRFGFSGAAIGFALGAVDEYLVRNNYTNTYYISNGLLGASFLCNVGGKYKTFATAIGTVIGLTATMGFYDEKLIPTVISTTALYGAMGPKGAIAGAAIGATELLIEKHNITQGNMLTKAAIEYSLIVSVLPFIGKVLPEFIIKFANTPYIAPTMKSLLVPFILYQSNATEAITWAPLEFGKQLYHTYSRIESKTQLNPLIEQHVLIAFANELLVQKLLLGISTNKQLTSENFHGLKGKELEENWVNFNNAIAKFTKFLGFYFAIGSVKKTFTDLVKASLTFSMTQSLNDKIFDQESLLKLTHVKDSNALMEHAKEDKEKVLEDGPKLIIGALSTLIKSSINLEYLINEERYDLMSVFVFYERYFGYLVKYANEQARSFDDAIRDHSAVISEIEKNSFNNAQTITAQGGMEYVNSQLAEEHTALETLKIDSQIWQSFAGFLQQINGWSSFLIKYYFIGAVIKDDPTKFGERFKLLSVLEDAQEIFSWENTNSQERIKVEIALAKVNKILDECESQENKVENAHRNPEQAEYNAISFSNFSVGIRNVTLIKIDEFTISTGVYALTGKSGSGKTSLITKTIGIENTNVWSKGMIKFLGPENTTKVVIATQENHLPIYSTLLQVIYFPKLLPNEETKLNKVKEQVVSYMKLLGLDSMEQGNNLVEKLDTKEKDWSKNLSGGQIKKVKLISALIKESPFIILDEIFAGMDQKSIIASQKLIKATASKSVVIIVDHHAGDNNYNGIYAAGEIHIENNTMHLLNLPSKVMGEASFAPATTDLIPNLS